MAENASYFLKAAHLSKSVMSGDNSITILKDVNLSVKIGDTIAILGTSGSGKTTLLTLLAGLDLPSSGDIYFYHHHLNKLDEEARALIRGQHVGFIFQSFHLLPSLTALENVMLPLEIRYVPHAACRAEASKWLHKVGLGLRLDHYPAQLSGGEQQRVAIARAFVSHPQLILADEMTGNLDVHTGQMITDILFELNKEQHTTLVLVTHDAKLANKCQQQWLLQEGVLVPC